MPARNYANMPLKLTQAIKMQQTLKKQQKYTANPTEETQTLKKRCLLCHVNHMLTWRLLLVYKCPIEPGGGKW